MIIQNKKIEQYISMSKYTYYIMSNNTNPFNKPKTFFDPTPEIPQFPDLPNNNSVLNEITKSGWRDLYPSSGLPQFPNNNPAFSKINKFVEEKN